MILFINGSFGVGKTTAARILRKQINGSVLYNPEWAGSVLMRLPLKLKGSGTNDFQDLELWRKSVVKGIRIFRLFARETVIVPMALYRQDYLEEILDGIRKFDKEIRLFCLKANFETILKRLEMRGEKIEDSENNWAIHKAKQCVESQRDERFGETLDTNEMNAVEVAGEILKRLNIS